MEKYKISVIVPVYNVKEYIVETMESIFNQTLQDFELILVDDGSSDGSYEILQGYEKKHSNIKLIRQENSGPSKARNVGLEIATGEYIIFVDSDDLMPEDSFEYRYKIAKEKDAEVVVFATEKTTDGKDRIPIKRHLFKEEYKTLGEQSDILWALGPCNKIFKKDSLEGEYLPLEINYAEDQVFVMNAFLNSKKIYATNKAVYYYRMRKNPGESLTQQIQVNASNILNQVCEVWKLVASAIDEKVKDKKIASKIKGEYFYRLMTIDVYPSLSIVLKEEESDKKQESLNGLINLIDNVNSEDINSISGKGKFKSVIKNKKITNIQKLEKLKNIMFLYKCKAKLKQIVGI